MKMIDVSYAQGKIDWKKVKADGIEGVIIRAGYGKGNADDFFVRNITGAIKQKMHVGIYWFSYAYTAEMAKREARYCNDLIQTYKLNIDLPVFFDWEYASMDWILEYGHLSYAKNNYSAWKPLITEMTEAFCAEITKLGYVGGYYANHDYYNNYYEPSKLKKFKLWFCDWEDDYKNCYIQQTSKSGEVNGITGAVDTDVLWGKLATEKPSTSNTSDKDNKPVKKPSTKSKYKVGETYTVDVNSALNVRTGAGIDYPLVGYSNLTPNAQEHAVGSALLPGTRVTCLKVKTEGKNTWIEIPSGWICAVNDKNVYVK